MILKMYSCVEYLPEDVSCARETRDLIIECCVGEGCFLCSRPPSIAFAHTLFVSVCRFAARVEFIHLISSEANEICEQESKKTIAPDHIITALKVCPFQSRLASLVTHDFI